MDRFDRDRRGGMAMAYRVVMAIVKIRTKGGERTWEIPENGLWS